MGINDLRLSPQRHVMSVCLLVIENRGFVLGRLPLLTAVLAANVPIGDHSFT